MGDVNFVDLAKSYIENNINLQLDKQKGNWLKIRDLNIRIYVNGSKLYPSNFNLPTYGWYDLSENTYDEILNDQINKCYNLIIFGDTNTCFLIPYSEFLNIFDKKFMTKPKEWMFHIFKDDNKYILKFTNGSNQSEITNFLNNLDPIQKEVDNKEHIINLSEPTNKNKISYKKEPLVFVTGYDENNLSHSISHKILGWRNNSNILSKGDYVFVYNKNSHMIQTAFIVGDKSSSRKPIWDEENLSDTHEVKFPYRWNAEVIRDDLQIGLDVINSFEPFNGNAVQKFIPLVGNNFPTVLSNEKYTNFRNFLLQYLKTIDQINNEKDQQSYWKIAPGEQASQWEEQLKNGVIAIGWNDIGDLSNRSIDDISDSIKKIWPEGSNAIILQFKDFLAIRDGDIVIANKGFSKIVGIGKIVGKYAYRPDLSFHHTYPVKWFDTNERTISPQKGIWRKTISRISQELYNEIIKQINSTYLLIRHQPIFKRTKNEREYWNDLLGKEYHFGKNVINYKKLQPGTKTIWFYTDNTKIYLLGHGDVYEITNIQNEDFVATFKEFTLYNKGSGIELDQSTQNNIKSLDSWNPYNSIIEIGEQIYNEILRNMQLKSFDDKPLSFLTSDQIKEGYDKISDILLIPKNKVIEILIAITSGRHILLAGPIGTGKTRLSSLIPEIFWEKNGGYLAETYTATADWNTQDVIGGIYPKMDNGKVVYDIQYGCVVETVARNWEFGINGGRRIESRPQQRNQSNKFQEKKSNYRGVWLIIDEFNRADIDKAFGQLFTALRTRLLKIPTNQIGSSYQDLTIPQDYRIIGTLNTADKHFLFQLSDALKSRFAYIEVDIPKKEEYEKEIFYALKNAIYELDLKKEDYEEFIGLDVKDRKIVPGSLSPDFYHSLLQAYDFLDSVRAFKKIGTAILQIIYQNMLVAMRITRDAKTTLDSGLTSTLLPQLENLPLAALGVLETFYNENMNDKHSNIVNYFKDAYKNPNRQSFGESFKNVLKFLQLDNYEKKGEDFSNGRLNVDNDVIWTIIGNAFVNKKKSFDSDMPQFRKGVIDLRKSAVI